MYDDKSKVRADTDKSDAEIIIDDYFESIKEKARIRTRLIKIVCLLVGVIMCIALIFVCVILFFKVTDITVNGNSFYTEDEIVAASEVKSGQNIFTVSSEKMAKALGRKLPNIYSVKVKHKFPDEITITVYEEKPLFYFEISGDYIVISEDMKVLGVYHSRSEIENKFGSLVCVVTPDISYAVVGQIIVFKDKEDGSFIVDLIETLKNNGIGEKVTIIYANNRFDISLTYDGRFNIELGNTKDFEAKLDFATGIIASFKDDTSGNICVKDVSNGYALVNNPENLIK